MYRLETSLTNVPGLGLLEIERHPKKEPTPRLAERDYEVSWAFYLTGSGVVLRDIFLILLKNHHVLANAATDINDLLNVVAAFARTWSWKFE